MPDSAQSSHPGASQLAAFVLGKLAAAERAALEAHLAKCPACRDALLALPASSESVGGQSTIPPVGPPKILPLPPDAPTATLHNRPVPADLVDHAHYEVLEIIGQGGMGAVYKARHKVMNRLVALKVINAQFVGSSTSVERFHREVQAAAKLHHPNIVTAFDADQAGDTHFLVMEFVEGTDLAKYVQKKGPLPANLACHFIRQSALGLQHAHERGMVHRDIKPHNLMLESAIGYRQSAIGEEAECRTPNAEGRVKVMDFGLARLARETASAAGLTGENVLMGTADYIAPEQAEDAHKADIRADIYSLGCSLFHLLAGRPPFDGGNVVQKVMAHAAATPPLAELPAATPAGLRTVLAKMMEKYPAKRYQTPGEVAKALVPFIKKATGVKASQPALTRLLASNKTPSIKPDQVQGDATVAAAAAPVKRPRKRKRDNRWPVAALIGMGAFAAVALSVSVVYVASRPPKPAGIAPADRPVAETSRPPVEKPVEPLPVKFTNSIGMEFVLVPKGKFLMGGSGGIPGNTEVTISRDFYLGVYEVTQEQWQTVMESNPSHFSRSGSGKDAVKDVPDADLKRFPVENVSWDDAKVFLAALNARQMDPAWKYALPTSAEWEYACRGGPFGEKAESGFDYYFDKPTNELQPEHANFNHGKSLIRTCKVGSHKQNRLGLYDMHGSVCEWCEDAEGASVRVVRGGCWSNDSGDCRATSRIAYHPSHRCIYFGWRLARVPVGK